MALLQRLRPAGPAPAARQPPPPSRVATGIHAAAVAALVVEGIGQRGHWSNEVLIKRALVE